MTKTEAIVLRDSYVANREAMIAKSKEEKAAYDQARKEWKESIANIAKEIINNDAVQVTADSSWICGGSGVEIRITNDFYPRKKDISLMWNIDICFAHDGTISFKSNCWSGFEMTSKENFEDIKNSVSIMETIINYDWTSVRLPEHPDYNEYIHTYVGRDETKDYEDMIREAEMDECLSDSKIIIVTEKYSTRYYKLIKQTEKFYTYAHYIDYSGRDNKKSMDEIVKYFENDPYTERCNKIKFFGEIGRHYSVANY